MEHNNLSADDEFAEPDYLKDCAGFYLDFASKLPSKKANHLKVQRLQRIALSFYIGAWFGLGARTPHPARADEHKVINDVLERIEEHAGGATLESATLASVAPHMSAGEGHFRYMFGKFVCAKIVCAK